MAMVHARNLLESGICCGDCSASEPSWVSTNRGLLLCSECASVHRSLGRHISVVKSLHQSTWYPSLLNFLNTVSPHTANNVWEDSLRDSTHTKNVCRKPNPKDPLHTTKSDFIKAKHVDLSFISKPNVENGQSNISSELHSSVRTNNLESSLRLLVLGADPNYFHEEKLSTPLHVAAKYGQILQIELLLLYGAEINTLDGNGQTPIEVANANKHNNIAERLNEAMFELTDRITLFVGGKRPYNGKTLKLGELEQNNQEISEELKMARGKLQLIPNKMFEELVMDLYDEVDRRENEYIWIKSTQNPDIGSVPFLPANPFLSATRNQGRQKLARFSQVEFVKLLTDVLIDARRRQNMANLRPLDSIQSSRSQCRYSNISDDEPLYDAVAPDDDSVAPSPNLSQGIADQPVNDAEIEKLRMQLLHYMSEITQLKNVVQKLSSENTELKSKCTENNPNDSSLLINLNESETADSTSEVLTFGNDPTAVKRSVSMYEARLGHKNSSGEYRSATSMYQMPGDNPRKFNQSFVDEVRQRTDVVTKCLKEICKCLEMQDVANKDNFVNCADRIRIATAELISIFNSQNCTETIQNAITQLNVYNGLIQHKCENLQNSISTNDAAAIDKFMQEVRDCVLHLAGATKALILEFQ